MERWGVADVWWFEPLAHIRNAPGPLYLLIVGSGTGIGAGVSTGVDQAAAKRLYSTGLVVSLPPGRGVEPRSAMRCGSKPDGWTGVG